MFFEFDRLAMTRALALAERGLETTHPNPRVGCVIAQGDRIIGEGFHERAGEPHAEVMALRSAKEPVAGATAYVTLEPCSHHGRTPPCVNALIEARIARVVFAVQDPNPRVSGQGADALLRAGIIVEAGLMQNEATELNIGFMKRMREGLPWVRVKLAMSLDGRTALANGASQWITGEAARTDVQRWRARCSAVMTGVGTVLADDPQLNVRLPAFKGRQPLRVVLDARLRSPVGARMFAEGVGSAGGGAAGKAAAGGDAGAAAAKGTAGGDAGVAAAKGTAGGDVVIFTAADGGVAGGTARVPALADPSALEGDMAALVSAFETSPTSVAARTDSVSAPAASVKSEPRPAAPIKAGSPAAAGAVPSAGAGQAAPVTPATAVPGTVMDLYPSSGNGKPAATVAAGVEPASPAAASPAGAGTNWSVRTAAAAGAAGVAPPADDATWAGAALSGAIAVKSDADASGASTTRPNGATPPPAVGAPLANPAVPQGPEAALQSRAALLATATIGDTVVISNPAAPGTPTAPTATAASGVPKAPVAHAGPGASNVAVAPVAPKASVAPAAPPLAAVPTAAGTAPPSAVHPGAVPSGAAIPGTPPPKQPAKADSPAAFEARRGALAAKGVRIEEVPSDDGFLDLFAVLKKLGEMEVNEVLIEAGPTLAGQLFTTFLVDELLLYVAPKFLGPQGRPLVNLPELQSLQDAWGFSLFDAKRFGDDLRLRMRPK